MQVALLSDQDLIGLYLEGNDKAFEELFKTPQIQNLHFHLSFRQGPGTG